jgi:ubiquinone/menaquinone biosynthesis C-methylase UbiE
MSRPSRSRVANACDRRGGAFYDDSELFERYQQHRAWPLNPNVAMEGPALFDELGTAVGLRVLDVGCGDAEIGRELLNSGAVRYRGVDRSTRMVQAARRTLEGTTGEALLCDIEDLDEPANSFDLVLSLMALHYVGDLGRVLRASARASPQPAASCSRLCTRSSRRMTLGRSRRSHVRTGSWTTTS